MFWAFPPTVQQLDTPNFGDFLNLLPAFCGMEIEDAKSKISLLRIRIEARRRHVADENADEG